MAEPWEAEIPFSTELAVRLIASQFPELEPVCAEPYGRGWDNVALLVNGEWVFRFPQRALAQQTMEGELACLAALPANLPLAVPRPRFVGHPGLGYPWVFSGYRELTGSTFCRAAVPMDQRIPLAAPLGAFLHALHSLHLEPSVRDTLHGDRIGRADLQRRLDALHTRLGEIASLPAGINRSILWTRILELAGTEPWAEAPRVVHGDFYGRHLIVDAVQRPCGVIDWGDAHLGDPALDLSIAYTLLPPDARRPFFDAYGPLDRATMRRAQCKALAYGIILLHYGEQVADAAMAQLGREALSLTSPSDPAA